MIELVSKLTNEPVHNIMTIIILISINAETIKLIEKQNARPFLPGLFKKFSDIAFALADILAQQFGALDRNKMELQISSDLASEESLAAAGRPVQKQPATRLHERVENPREIGRQNYRLSYFLLRPLHSADHAQIIPPFIDILFLLCPIILFFHLVVDVIVSSVYSFI